MAGGIGRGILPLSGLRSRRRIMDQRTSHNGSGVRKGLPKVRSSERTRVDGFAGDLRDGKRRVGNQASKKGDSAARSLARRQRRALPSSLGGLDWACIYCKQDLDPTSSRSRYHKMCWKRKRAGTPPPYSSSKTSSGSVTQRVRSTSCSEGRSSGGAHSSVESEGKPTAIKPPRVQLSPRKWCGWNPGWLGGKVK